MLDNLHHFHPGLFSLKGVSLLSLSKNLSAESNNLATVRPKPRLALSISQVASPSSSTFVMKGSGPHLTRFVCALHLSCTVLWGTHHLLAAFRMLNPSSASFMAFSMCLSLSKIIWVGVCHNKTLKVYSFLFKSDDLSNFYCLVLQSRY